MNADLAKGHSTEESDHGQENITPRPGLSVVSDERGRKGTIGERHGPDMAPVGGELLPMVKRSRRYSGARGVRVGTITEHG